ncbi:hypothetical protein PRUB_a0674 [Pseudoalteromonas rubra]|uniref:Uncharacterized protein n=1 Tax=Pseudoalteromonas rubra TaxID=43658 RepID=A0A8T0C7Z9_9GAMM|nr:hypothetical protein PRUB_a0674 [Pseudoalteromonas rubra]
MLAEKNSIYVLKSGFRFHQILGLVYKEYKGMVSELRAIHA